MDGECAHDFLKTLTLGDLRDARCYDRFVRHAYARLYAVAYQVVRNQDDACDVTQDVLVELWEIATTRLRERNALVLPVAYQLLKRRATDWRIRNQKEPSPVSDLQAESPAGDDDPDQLLDRIGRDDRTPTVEAIAIAIEKREAIEALRHVLTPREEAVFTLLIQDKSAEEIARQMQVTPARVSQLRKSMAIRLKKALQEMGYECHETIGVPLYY